MSKIINSIARGEAWSGFPSVAKTVEGYLARKRWHLSQTHRIPHDMRALARVKRDARKRLEWHRAVRGLVLDNTMNRRVHEFVEVQRVNEETRRRIEAEEKRKEEEIEKNRKRDENLRKKLVERLVKEKAVEASQPSGSRLGSTKVEKLLRQGKLDAKPDRGIEFGKPGKSTSDKRLQVPEASYPLITSLSGLNLKVPPPWVVEMRHKNEWRNLIKKADLEGVKRFERRVRKLD